MSKHAGKNDQAIIAGYAARRRVADIAKDLGVTRNVVIGRARRLGLSETGRQGDEISRAHQVEAQRIWREAHPEAARDIAARCSARMKRWWEEHPEHREAQSARLKSVWARARA